MAELVLPDDLRSLAELFAGAVSVPPGGRLELVFDESLRYVDGYIKPRNERLTPSHLASTSVFCSCLINTTTVHGLCIVCQRPKRQAD